jgi:hypothetical protein
VVPPGKGTCSCKDVRTLLDDANLALSDQTEQPYDTETSLAIPLVGVMEECIGDERQERGKIVVGVIMRPRAGVHTCKRLCLPQQWLAV